MTETQKAATKRRALSGLQQADAVILIRAHCSRAEDGTAVYQDGWSDEAVGKALAEQHPGVDFSPATIERLRAEAVGPLPKAARKLDRLEALEVAVAVLTRRVDDLAIGRLTAGTVMGAAHYPGGPSRAG